MPIEVLLAMLGGAFLNAIWNVIIKSGENKFFETGLNTLSAGICVLFILPFVQVPNAEVFPYILASATIHILYYYNVAGAYKRSDLSYSFSLMRGFTPILTSLTMFILGTNLTAGSWFGIILLSVSIIALAAESLKQKNFSFKTNLSVFFIAFITMTYTIIDGHGVQLYQDSLSYAVWFFVFNALPTNIIILAKNKKAYLEYAKKRWHYGLFGGLSSLISYGIVLWAMTKAPIAIVASLRETSVIFAMILATIYLGEKMTKTRVVAVILVILGTFCLKYFS